MGILKTSALEALRGQVGKELVFKKYGDKTVVTRYPRMNGIERSPRQKLGTSKFKEAVAYARSIIKDEKKRKAFAKKLRRGKSVYHAAISEFMKKH